MFKTILTLLTIGFAITATEQLISQTRTMWFKIGCLSGVGLMGHQNTNLDNSKAIAECYRLSEQIRKDGGL